VRGYVDYYHVERAKDGIITNGTVTVSFGEEGFDLTGYQYDYGYIELKNLHGAGASAFEIACDDRVCLTQKCPINAGTFTVVITDFEDISGSGNEWVRPR
jgi:hypothetical protein